MPTTTDTPVESKAPGHRNPMRGFILWVALPALAVYIGVCLLVFVTLSLMSGEMNTIDSARTRSAIAAAIDSLVEQLGESTSDEATWTEAFVNTSGQSFNPAWLDATWGATARISDTYDTAIVTDNTGKILFGESVAGAISGNLRELFSSGSQLLAELQQNIVTDGDSALVAHLASRGGTVYAIAGAIIHGNVGQAGIPPNERRLLWLARVLDDTLLHKTASRFQLPQPRLVRSAAGDGESLPLLDAAGSPVGALVWTPRRPGDPAFAHTAGIAAFVMLVIGLLLVAVLAAFRHNLVGRAASEARDWHNARHDPATGLPNARGLEEALRRAMPRGNASVPVSVALVGIDGLPQITASYGRETGERLIAALADSIGGIVAGEATVARIGPAELALARPGEGAPALVRRFCRRLLEIVSEPIAVGDLRLKIGASLGTVDATCTAQTISEAMRMAESALARARETGGSHVVEYHSGIENERQERLSLEADIRRGLDEGEFDLEYQPIIDFATQGIAGVEALLRWDRRAGGPKPPSEFIPAAEASGLIEELGMLALRRAVAEIGPLGNLKISVNISTAQFRNPMLEEAIEAALDESDVPPHRLQLEITESFLLNQPGRAARIIDGLRERGILIALDDFGTGFSSIGYLRQFKFDRVKLDRSLVENIDNDQVLSAMVHSTMLYAFARGLAVTAEGVERREEAAALTRLGCREFQGFFFARPMPLARLQRLLAEPNRMAG